MYGRNAPLAAESRWGPFLLSALSKAARVHTEPSCAGHLKDGVKKGRKEQGHSCSDAACIESPGSGHSCSDAGYIESPGSGQLR